MKIALLSAAVSGDNSGDAIIETAVRRLVKASDFTRFPLTQPLTDEDIAAINTHDKLLICGTNLYQRVFASNLSVEIVNRIKIPIIPFGIGSSAAIGSIPVMNEEGIKTVRAIHQTCRASSVRDMASYKFLKSIGVENVRLTGCPVLFHGLSCPEFSLEGEGYTLTPRARLLHIEDSWNDRQSETLARLSDYYRPQLVLQSPYDIPVAEELANKYGLQIIMDEKWQADKYIELAKSQYINMGFRLHFAMLSISYGKPAFLVSHDSRASEFCELIKIPLIDIKNYSDNSLILQIDTKCFDSSGVQKRWDELSVEMSNFMKEIEVESNLNITKQKNNPKPSPSKKIKPKVLLLVDKPGWAFDHSAKNIAKVLENDFEFEFAYIVNKPKLNPDKYDLMYVFFWGEDYYKQFGFRKEQIVKELSSHRWEDNPLYGPCTPEELVEKYLSDSGTIICTSLRLLNIIKDIHPNVLHTPNGFSHQTFYPKKERSGEMVTGWAGNIKDSVKGFNEFVKPACEGNFKLLSAPGTLNHAQMNDFYNQLDVFTVSSKNEGEPLTLVESMAAGCFPICTDVGIAPELINNYVNGIVLKERSIEAFKEAINWCSENLYHVRKKGKENAEQALREREWHITGSFFKFAFNDAYKRMNAARFRNDDVSFDTDITNFKKFCRLFTKCGQTQIHGITLNGNTNTLFEFENEPVEYEGKANISKMDYESICKLSEGKAFLNRKDIIKFLNESKDEIALHGLYHTDYSKMTEEQQRKDIREGLQQLKSLFAHKEINYFIPPFNRTNEHTFKVCKEFSLEVLGTEGKHLEAELDNLVIENKTLYRYHHHRFYPETKFKYYSLSWEKLELTLGRNFSMQPELWPLVKVPEWKTKRQSSLLSKIKNTVSKAKKFIK